MGIVARHEDIGDRPGVVSRLLSKGTERTVKPTATLELETIIIINDVALVLSSENIEGSNKRGVVGTVIDHVVCHSFQPIGR